jgi:hypothetical protein
MEQQNPQARGRSLSAASAGGAPAHQQPHIRNGHSPHSPEPSRFSEAVASSAPGLGLGIDSASQFPGTQPEYSPYNSAASPFVSSQQAQSFDPSASFDPNQGFTQQLGDDNPSFGAQTQGAYQQNLLAPTFGDGDFALYPPTSGEQYDNTPLFSDPLGSRDSNMMQSHTTTPPHLLKPDPGSANHSPNFNTHQFSPSPGRHSRNVSLGPEAALLPGQQLDWSQTQFQGHRRSPSEYSDVSSAAPSPNLVSSDNFDQMDHNHSPMQRPQDPAVYQELHGLGSFSLSEQGTHSPRQHGGRSPSHSPAISPRLLPQQIPDMSQQNNFMLQTQNNAFAQGPYIQGPQEAFPQLPSGGPDMSGVPEGMPAPPSINIDYAPTAIRPGFEQPKSLDMDALSPPESRGMRLPRLPILFLQS